MTELDRPKWFLSRPFEQWMIIINTPYVNGSNITQDIYAKIIERIDRQTIQCDCGNIGMNIHSYYEKSIKTREGKLKLLIVRLKCRSKSCNKTHAVLLSCMIPYSYISLEDTITIIQLDSEQEICDFLKEHNYILMEDVRNIKRRFKKFWKERLMSENITFNDHLTLMCIKTFKRQFMQNRCTSIKLISLTTWIDHDFVSLL